jgi:deoxyribose-phosphate aldolase
VNPDNATLAELVRGAAQKALSQPISIQSPPGTIARPASLIDHTLLKATATADQIRLLCAEAQAYQFAAVCVNPVWVSLCAELLKGSPVKVCAVVGFPLGADLTDAKRFETERCVALGAGEIDMVIHVGALKAQDFAGVRDDIAAVVSGAHAGGALVKVIIEAAYLTDEEKVAACVLAVQAGADFVKTSTGFGPSGATAADVALMRRVVGPDIGVKAAGGIRSAADFRSMVAAGANRIGASAGVTIMAELAEQG